MTIAVTLARYLAEQGVPCDVMQHPHTVTASETAKASHVPIDRLAKAKGEDGHMLAVLPASCHIQFSDLRRQLGTDVPWPRKISSRPCFAIASLGRCLRLEPPMV